MVRGLKAGRIEFRNDKTGVVHAPIGKASFEAGNIAENLTALHAALEGAKPANAKGVYIRSMYLTTTMGPSIQITLA
jgi:large subunit ribosomal protein L1